MAFLVLPIALTGLLGALAEARGGAVLVLVAALFGRALDGHKVVPDTMVAETAALVAAFWIIGAYLHSQELFPAPPQARQLPLLGAAAGALVGAAFFGGVAFAPLSVAGAMALAGVGAVAGRGPIVGRRVLLEPLRVMSVMVAAYWLIFHVT